MLASRPVDAARRRGAVRTLGLVAAAQLVLAAAAHRFDSVLAHHAWLALLPPVAAQLLRRPRMAGAAPVVAGLLGAALGALVLVLLGDRTWAYLAWLGPAAAAAAAVAGLLHRRFHRRPAPTGLESGDSRRTVAEE